MTYFTEKTWWDTNFKIRRSISLTPFSFLPGSETLCAAKFIKNDINGKIKPDYSDLKVIYQDNDGINYLIPHYTLDEGDYLSVVFEPVTSLTYIEPATPEYATPLTQLPLLVESATPPTPESATPYFTYIYPEAAVPVSDNEYFFYYGGKSESKWVNQVDDLNPNFLVQKDYGQLDELTRMTFQKPSIHWSLNTSQVADAKATFEFIGHRADLFFDTGPQFGKFEYTVNNGSAIEVDCYDEVESVKKVAAIDSGFIGVNKIRIRALGTKNPAAQNENVRLSCISYNQTLIGELNAEEFYSSIGKTITTGS